MLNTETNKKHNSNGDDIMHARAHGCNIIYLSFPLRMEINSMYSKSQNTDHVMTAGVGEMKEITPSWKVNMKYYCVSDVNYCIIQFILLL